MNYRERIQEIVDTEIYIGYFITSPLGNCWLVNKILSIVFYYNQYITCVVYNMVQLSYSIH